MIHTGRRERVKQRFLNEGYKSFEEHELLELLLYYSIPQKDTNELAHTLLNHFNSFDQLLEADYNELIKISGIGSNTAILLKLILPFFSFYNKSKYVKKVVLKTREQLLKYCLWLLQYERTEHFYAIYLNSNYEFIGKTLIAKGTNTEVKAYPKLIVEAALRTNSKYVVLCHNHISDNVNPSNSDEETTMFIDKLLDMIDIVLLDHIIVSNSIVYSMKNRMKYDNVL